MLEWIYPFNNAKIGSQSMGTIANIHMPTIKYYLLLFIAMILCFTMDFIYNVEYYSNLLGTGTLDTNADSIGIPIVETLLGLIIIGKFLSIFKIAIGIILIIKKVKQISLSILCFLSNTWLKALIKFSMLIISSALVILVILDWIFESIRVGFIFSGILLVPITAIYVLLFCNLIYTLILSLFWGNKPQPDNPSGNIP